MNEIVADVNVMSRPDGDAAPSVVGAPDDVIGHSVSPGNGIVCLVFVSHAVSVVIIEEAI